MCVVAKSKRASQMSVAHNGVAVTYFKSMYTTVYTQPYRMLRPYYSRQKEHTTANKSATRMEYVYNSQNTCVKLESVRRCSDLRLGTQAA